MVGLVGVELTAMREVFRTVLVVYFYTAAVLVGEYTVYNLTDVILVFIGLYSGFKLASQ